MFELYTRGKNVRFKRKRFKTNSKKHEVQRDYLDNHNFTTATGQVKSLLDVSFSANHSKRYYSEIINKINTINDIIAMEETQYQSIFITVTLDGYFRDFLKGNFSRLPTCNLNLPLYFFKF